MTDFDLLQFFLKNHDLMLISLDLLSLLFHDFIELLSHKINVEIEVGKAIRLTFSFFIGIS